VPANTTLHARVSFTLALPVGASDRFGTRSDATWWGTGFPLLSYVRGEGYKTEPPTTLFAETATSEEFRLADLAVTAPAGDTVIANGKPGTRRGNTWHFSASSVRDVAVATGRFRIARTTASGVPVTVGVARSLPDDATTVAGVIAAAVRDHVRRFGPFPFAQLNVPVVPDVHGGIEYPGEIYLGTHQLDATPSHEVGHEYFYGLVGNDQARDPWLDESFATYVEALDRGQADYYAGATIPAAGRDRVGRPMTYWEKYGENTYFRSVYLQGATALINARNAAGAAAFDRAIRCYVNRLAHRVARPDDLAAALRGLPKALGVLRRAGAID
jgi:aminopeptidase N